MDYARALKIIRALRNLSQQELAEKVGISKSLLSRIESNNRTLSKTTLKKISRELSIPEDVINLLASKPSNNSKLTEKDTVKFGKDLLYILQEIHA